MNSKAIIAVVVLVILGGGIWYMQGTITPPAPITAPAAVTEQVAPNQNNAVTQEPAPTGKVDDLLASLGDEQSQEAAAVTAGDTDAETVLSDGTAINDLSQTYDETQL
jgi:hypothetical protein